MKLAKKIFSVSVLSTFLLISFATSAKGLEVHEWGTFTSFMGADGRQVEGLHHEDEPLPSFVYGLKKEDEGRAPLPNPLPRPCRPNTKVGCEGLLRLERFDEELPEAPLSSGITQKMETPVLYFYGEPNTNVKVELKFPQGIITQYFPEASSHFPKLTELSGIGPSHYVFDVKLLDKKTFSNSQLMNTNADSIWNPARAVDSNPIRANNGSAEKFIFYRGVGDFQTNLKVSSVAGDKLKLENLHEVNISNAFILNADGKRGVIATLGEVKDQLSAEVPVLDATSPSMNEYVATAKEKIRVALVAAGLFNDEALALVNTWERSYFLTPGLRVLYIVPRGETDRLIPINIQPTPEKLVRVLVGRIEIMTAKQESAFLETLKNVSRIDAEGMFGRFFDSKLRRLAFLAKSQGDQDLSDKIVGFLQQAIELE